MRTTYLPTLDDFELAPSQAWGAVRLVPLLRRHPLEGLRLHALAARSFGALTRGNDEAPKQAYCAYVPHAMVLRVGDDLSATLGTTLTDKKVLDGKRLGPLHHRLAKRMKTETGSALRFLPLHLAMEGFLVHHFGGPSRIWREYSDEVMRNGLSPRFEWSVLGHQVPDLNDALRVFELHPNQCGVLFYVGDRFRSAFVVPHAEEYAALHRTLLTDFFADTILHDGLYTSVPDWTIDTRSVDVRSVDDLRAFLSKVRGDWSAFHQDMASGLFGVQHQARRVYSLRSFELLRFLPSFELESDSHIGEAIVKQSGELAYLKTYRLSQSQARRGYLLGQLAKHEWDLAACAATLRQSKAQLVRRLEKAGFAYLFKAHVVRDARAGRLI